MIYFIFHGFNCFRRHAINDYWKYFEVLQMAQPRIIFYYLPLDIVEEVLKNEELCH